MAKPNALISVAPAFLVTTAVTLAEVSGLLGERMDAATIESIRARLSGLEDTLLHLAQHDEKA